MKTLKRMFVSYKVRPCPDPTYSVIYMRLQSQGKRVEFSLNLKIRTSKWDTVRDQVKGSPEIGEMLTGYKSRAYALRLHHPEKSLQEIRDLIFEVPEEKPVPKISDLVEVGKLLLERKQKRFEQGRLAAATIRKAQERQKNLEFIFRKTKWRWPLDDIRTQHLDELETWLRHSTKWHWNTASKILNHVKEVIKFGQSEGWIVSRPLVLRVSFKSTQHHSLTKEQLTTLEGLTWVQPEM